MSRPIGPTSLRSVEIPVTTLERAVELLGEGRFVKLLALWLDGACSASYVRGYVTETMEDLRAGGNVTIGAELDAAWLVGWTRAKETELCTSPAN